MNQIKDKNNLKLTNNNKNFNNYYKFHMLNIMAFTR